MTRPPAAALDEDAVWAVIDHERLDLAALVESLPEQELDAPSLCDGWSVRDVAAHLALAHTGLGRALVEAVRARGSFDRMVRDSARRHAAVPREQVVAEIRAMVGSRRLAPGLSPLEPLTDVLVHGQDIAVPLGRPRTMPVEAAATAATRVWTSSWPLSRAFRARPRLRGLQLVATDVEWSVGAGLPVTGPVSALLLLLTGRQAGRDRLSGPGLSLLRDGRR